MLALSLVFGTDYNGAGMSVVNKVLAGESVVWYAFLLKIAFTALTLGAGFKGGEIVPAMFIGATFGAVMATLLGLNVAFGGDLGLVVVFCGAVNAPLASIILSVELFGGGSVMYFALACALCFVLSGKAGLYSVQKNVFSRISAERYEQINEL